MQIVQSSNAEAKQLDPISQRVGGVAEISRRSSFESVLFEIAKGSPAEIEKKFLDAFELGIFEARIPGFFNLKGCEQPPEWHAEGDVLVHTGKVFVEMARLTDAMPASQRYVLLIAALVHDIEKPTMMMIRGGRRTFHGHAEAAALRSSEFAMTFGLNEAEESKLHYIVKHHMAAHKLQQLPVRARVRIYGSIHFDDLLTLQEADARGSWHTTMGQGLHHAAVAREVATKERASLMHAASQQARVRGFTSRMIELLVEAGFEPSPFFGKCRRELSAMVDAGTIVRQEDIAAWLKGYLEKNLPSNQKASD